MGGGNFLTRPPPFAQPGLSPRGRGKRSRSRLPISTTRSIPAWAGETPAAALALPAAAVYPRVGGGNNPIDPKPIRPSGLSPRGRGKPAPNRCIAARARSIPAWAGETSVSGVMSRSPGVYPRVGGGNIGQRAFYSPLDGLSPRGRGKRRRQNRWAFRRRSIPAWAGETPPYTVMSEPLPVYPRVGGGNSITSTASISS